MANKTTGATVAPKARAENKRPGPGRPRAAWRQGGVVRRSIELPFELDERLLAEAERQGTTAVDVIRRVLAKRLPKLAAA